VFVDDSHTAGYSATAPLLEIGKGNLSYQGSTESAFRHVYGSDSVSSMTAGSFYYDTGTHKLYVWLSDGSNPNNHTMEASTRTHWITDAYLSKYYTIQSLDFRHNDATAVSPGTGGGIEMPLDSIVNSVQANFADFADIRLGEGDTVEYSGAVYGGDLGILVGTTNYNTGEPNNGGYLIQSSSISHNNYRNFSQGWAAGGIKVIPNSFGTVQENAVEYNNGIGIWSDTNPSWAESNYNGHDGGWSDPNDRTVINANFVYENIPNGDSLTVPTGSTGESLELQYPSKAGIRLELSQYVLVTNNVVVNDGESGIMLSGCQDCLVLNNTIVNPQPITDDNGYTVDYAAIDVGGVPRPETEL
jgi:parallel beta-helix repeat protein